MWLQLQFLTITKALSNGNTKRITGHYVFNKGTAGLNHQIDRINELKTHFESCKDLKCFAFLNTIHNKYDYRKEEMLR